MINVFIVLDVVLNVLRFYELNFKRFFIFSAKDFIVFII